MKYLIKNANFIDWKNKLVVGKDLLINNGKIEYIGKVEKTSNIKIIDGNKYLLLPGFINSHFHLGETVFRGHAPNNSLQSYLDYTSKFNKKLKSEKNHHIISAFSILEAVFAGTTTISCARGWLATEESKLRGLLGYPIMKSEKLMKYYTGFTGKFNQISKKFPKLFKSGNTQISLGLWIHSLHFLDEDALYLISKLFNQNKNIRLTIHVAETKEGVKKIRKCFKGNEIEILKKFKLLNERTNLIHVNHINDDNIKLIARSKANITICPTSNLFLNTGLPNLRKFLAAGINTSIGTDGLATNYSASLVDAAKVTYFAFRNLDLKPPQLLDMITKNPAKALGFDKCGSIKEGNLADILFFKIEDSALNPIENTLKNFIFGKTILPIHVMIDGNFVVKNGKIANQKEIINNFEELASKIENETN